MFLALVALASVGTASAAPEDWSPPVSLSCSNMGASYWSVAAWDVDPDGPTKLALLGESEPLLLLSPADGVLESLNWQSPAHVASIASADVNGDGRSDLLLRTSEDLQNYNLGAAVQGRDLSHVDVLGATSRGDRFTGLGDVDGDGAQDVAFGQELWTSLPTAPWLTFRDSLGEDTYPQLVHPLGDVDGDGYDDLAVTRWTPGPLQGGMDVLLGGADAALSLSATIEDPTGMSAIGMVAVDVNIDSDPARELVVVRANSGYYGFDSEIRLLDDVTTGFGVTLATLHVGPSAAYQQLVTLSDGSAETPAVLAWNLGDRIGEMEISPGTIRAVVTYTPGPLSNVFDIEAVDLDLDGVLDLVAVGGTSPNYELVGWLRDGSGTLRGPTTTSVVTCGSVDDTPAPPPVTDDDPATGGGEPGTCGCAFGPTGSGGAAVLVWLVALGRRRRGGPWSRWSTNTRSAASSSPSDCGSPGGRATSGRPARG